MQPAEPVREAGEEQPDSGQPVGGTDRGTEGHTEEILQHPQAGQSSYKSFLPRGTDTGNAITAIKTLVHGQHW